MGHIGLYWTYKDVYTDVSGYTGKFRDLKGYKRIAYT